jgi:ABC-2 type transport system ATP-binding protein
MASRSVLSLQDVTLRYGEFVAVDSLCLEVSRGEVFGLLGPNGSGKSSTLSAIVGAVAPSAGVIRVAGLREADDPLAFRRNIGLVPQELALFEELTAEDNLLFFGRLYGLGRRELRRRVAEALDFVDLSERARRPVRTFSGGMQRRLNLACALLHRPPLMLLDEPTVGVDVRSREAIFANLRSLRDAGTAVVCTMHHLDEAELLCDRLGIMDRGRLLAAGTLDELCAALRLRAGRLRLDPAHGRVGSAGAPAMLEGIYLELTGRSLSQT